MYANNSFKHQLFVYTQFQCQKQFYSKQFSLAWVICFHTVKYEIVLFDPLTGPSLVLTLRVKVDQEAMAKNGYFVFSKTPVLLEPYYHCFISYPGHMLGGAGLIHVHRCSWCILQAQPTWFIRWWSIICNLTCHE